jgi:hypothetical protein
VPQVPFSAIIAPVIQRALLGGLAAAAIVVLAVWLHSSHLDAQGVAFRPTPAHPATKAQIASALSHFERAGHNNPDTKPEVDEATILIFLKRDTQATRLLGEVVRKEPRNATAWARLSQATSRSDPQLSQAAVARVLALAPPPASR